MEPNKWLNHFKSLHTTVAKNFENRFQELYSLLSEKEHSHNIFNELDNRITKKEISSAISSLKYNEAKGLDLISNEMLKSGHTVILPCLLNLFNLCFTYSYYPESWAKGYITPIFKSNDPCDPNNYRELTIKSNLGKLFNNV